MQNNEFKTRISRARKLLIEHISQQNLESGVIMISSACKKTVSRDQQYQYRQNSNFLYFLGTEELEDAALLIFSNKARPILLACSRTKEQIIWEGPGIHLKKLSEELDLELVDTNKAEVEVIKRLQGYELLFHNNEQDTLGLRLSSKILQMPTHQRARYPKRLLNVELITESLRLYKSAYEIEKISKANTIANTALLCCLPFVKSGKSEAQIAATIDYGMKLQDADPGFATIVASGKNAAILHHRASGSEIKNGQILLFDWGARKDGYCSDISRCITVGKNFSQQQKDIYEIVLSAQKAAIKKVKADVLVKAVYDAAVKELSTGLKELKIISQPVSKIIEQKLYKTYFPHGIGHTLGLDVHDIGQMRSENDIRLAKDMVITIEPGLYFAKNIKNISACGIRIEDNVLVEKSGCRVLSEGFPKEIKDIENLCC